MHRMMSLIFSQPHHRVEGPRDAGQLRGQLRGARVLQAERWVRLDTLAVYEHAAMQLAVINNLLSFPCRFVWRIKDPSGTHKARNHQVETGNRMPEQVLPPPCMHA